MAAFENEDFEQVFKSEVESAKKKRKIKNSDEQRQPHGSATMNPDKKLIQGHSERRIYQQVEGLQNFTVTDEQARSIPEKSIRILVSKGLKPYVIDQIVELMPDSSEPIKARIAGIEAKGGRFYITLMHYKESKEDLK